MVDLAARVDRMRDALVRLGDELAAARKARERAEAERDAALERLRALELRLDRSLPVGPLVPPYAPEPVEVASPDERDSALTAVRDRLQAPATSR